MGKRNVELGRRNSNVSNRLQPDKNTALVFDVGTINASLRTLAELTSHPKCFSLYSLKACAFYGVVNLISPHVDGFSCSSPNEFELALNCIEGEGLIQVVSPGLSVEFLESLTGAPDYLTFNSLEQFYRLEQAVKAETKMGIRVNPKTEFVANKKYDPCQVNSKLGVTVGKLRDRVFTCDRLRSRISGIHVHNNSEASDFEQLFQTALSLKTLLDSSPALRWVNLGGGYNLDASNPQAFHRTVNWLADDYGLDVILEPGNGVVRESGRLVATVVDVFESESKKIAVVDTTVTHAPEVFEYNWSPSIEGADPKGEFKYLIAGCSCLAGDVFGEYAFQQSLSVGCKVVFESLGAYSMAKASMFNGIGLPSVFVLTENGELDLRKSFSYDDFADRCGVSKSAFN